MGVNIVREETKSFGQNLNFFRLKNLPAKSNFSNIKTLILQRTFLYQNQWEDLNEFLIIYNAIKRAGSAILSFSRTIQCLTHNLL